MASKFKAGDEVVYKDSVPCVVQGTKDDGVCAVATADMRSAFDAAEADLKAKEQRLPPRRNRSAAAASSAADTKKGKG